MSKPWDPDALFIKAKLFLNHAMDDDSRQFDEQALWASLALELLAKAALAKVSPSGPRNAAASALMPPPSASSVRSADSTLAWVGPDDWVISGFELGML